jgi:4,5-dihydroxyphthalate decarboxylase
MSKLTLSVAVRDYDRTRPLSDGEVQIDGVDPVFMALPPEEIFFRAFRGTEFDICELSMSSFTVQTAQGGAPYVGVPAFVSRTFRHTAIYVRTDRIKTPADLKGKKIGVPEYQLTANVWARAILDDDHGVKPSDIHWIRAGLVEPGRLEKISITLPKDVKLTDAPADRTLSSMLESGEIDGIIAPRVPPPFERGHPNIGWLFSDPVAAAKDYFKRTGIFPIMHLIGVRRELAERHPWLPAAVFKAFAQAKAIALAKTFRHVIDESDVTVRRGAVDRGARADGRRFLVLRRRAKSQGDRLFLRAASRAGAFAAKSESRGAVPPGNAGDF